jgi:thymidine phosphorylase
VRSEDLEDKAIFLASKMLVLCGTADSVKSAEKLVRTQLAN